MSNVQDSEDVPRNVTADPSVWCEDGHEPKLLDEDGQCPECGMAYNVTLTVEVHDGD